MNDLYETLEATTFLPWEAIGLRLLVAAFLGACIGFEREWRRRPAGLRTHILVCLASATVAMVTIEVAQMAVFSDDTTRIDPVRLVEATTAGVAFLAAGMIVFARGEVHGLTTGAGMWLAGSIGLACGLGLWLIALFATAMALVVLHALRLVEHSLDLNRNDKAGQTSAEADGERTDAQR